MCGIVAIIQKNWDKPLGYIGQKVFKQMLYANALRGTDGTGYFYYNNKASKVIYQKLPVPSWEALPKMQELNNLMSEGRWIVGHNRKATAGLNTEANTHPFIDNFITLVHNGTLNNRWELEKDVGVEDVDSKLIPKLMNKHGNKQALEVLRGAYALVWYDDEKKRIFFARNEERPLFIVETKDFYVLSSEAELAEWVLSRNQLEVNKVTETQSGYIYALGENKHNKLFIHKTKFTPAVTPKVVTQGSKYYSPDYEYDYKYYHKQPTLPYIPPKVTTNFDKYSGARYKPGDNIIVKVDSIVQTYSAAQIKGTTIEQPHIKVDIQAGQAFTKINTKYVSCTVSAYLPSIIKESVIYAHNPYAVHSVEKSGNGMELTSVIMKELDLQRCSCCGDDSVYYFQDTYVSYDEKTKTYSYECSECSWKNHDEEMLKNYIDEYGEPAYAA